MELRTVNTFLHIAELHSFSRTARQLGYSQSAVSSQIAQLPRSAGKAVQLSDVQKGVDSPQFHEQLLL